MAVSFATSLVRLPCRGPRCCLRTAWLPRSHGRRFATIVVEEADGIGGRSAQAAAAGVSEILGASHHVRRSSTASSDGGRHRAGGPGRRQHGDGVTRARYEIPKPYLDLISTRPAESARASQEDAEAAEVEEPSRNMWREARALARRRLSADPDATPLERRLSAMHESLWMEELGVTQEFRRLHLELDELPRLGENMLAVDVTALGDEVMELFEDEAVVRGLRLRVRGRDGKKFFASPQPGSGSGVLRVAVDDDGAAAAGAPGPFRVDFLPLRFQEIAMHRALDASATQDLLAESTAAGDAAAESTSAHAASLPPTLNDGQRRLVAQAVEVSSRAPLVIWGPPGTGKTTVAAFLVWDLLQQRSNFRALVAAPSNTGADVLCSKLAKLGLDRQDMLRLNAIGRSIQNVPNDVAPFSHYTKGKDGRRVFGVPELKALKGFKVIVTTCICAEHIANVLRRAGASTGWFTHVIIDEAGEATEPETLVALSLRQPVAGRTILLGDHFQLGPLVITPLARQLGHLDISMIQRLANERFAAARDAMQGERSDGLSRDILRECEDRGLFFLTESYRSHADIMSMYSKLFYSDQLDHRPCQQQLSLVPYFESIGCRSPVILHNVVGMERRDPGCPSAYNPDEIRIVVKYLLDLLDTEAYGLTASDVGIITPYARQVRELERQIASMGRAFQGVQVGTVERFQGQERRAIIMSTVRSSKTGAGSPGARRPIGFLSDKRRLNVAISRAVAGLVVIGDVQTLARHSTPWNSLVEMAKETGSLVGEPFRQSAWPMGAKPPQGGDAAPRPVPQVEATRAWGALTSEG